jgi:hypothetical protein
MVAYKKQRKNMVCLFFFFSLFMGFPLISVAQLEVNCGGEKRSIPQDSIRSFKDNILVNIKILPPIGQSTAEFEIRYFNFGMRGPYEAIDIVRLNGTFEATGYVINYDVPNGAGSDWQKQYKEVGTLYYPPMKLSMDIILKKTPLVKLPENETWTSLTDGLIKNHLFDLIPEDQLDSVLKKKFGDKRFRPSRGLDDGSNYTTFIIEVKQGKQVRRIIYGASYDDLDDEQLRQTNYIFTTFYQLLRNNGM